MLYFRALIQGLDEIPAIDPAIRADIEAEATRSGWPALHQQLIEIDPETAGRLHP
jgi:tRNA dimethylallyltransferase